MQKLHEEENIIANTNRLCVLQSCILMQQGVIPNQHVPHQSVY